jgi:hypothetical protein
MDTFDKLIALANENNIRIDFLPNIMPEEDCIDNVTLILRLHQELYEYKIEIYFNGEMNRDLIAISMAHELGHVIQDCKDELLTDKLVLLLRTISYNTPEIYAEEAKAWWYGWALFTSIEPPKELYNLFFDRMTKCLKTYEVYEVRTGS